MRQRFAPFFARLFAPYGLGVNLLALAIAAVFIACNPLHIVHPDGRREVIAARDTWKRQQYEVRACLQTWVRAYYGDRTSSHFNDSLSKEVLRDTLVIESHVFALVHGDGAVYSDGERNHVAGALQKADSLLITARMFPDVDGGELRAVIRHEVLHWVQSTHGLLLQRPGDNHWAPPWDYCGIPRAFYAARAATDGTVVVVLTPGGLSPERHRLARFGPLLLFSHSLPSRSVHRMESTSPTRNDG